MLADRFAAALFYVAISIGAITFVVWAGIAGNLDFGIARTVTVLVIACPHALGSRCRSWSRSRPPCRPATGSS